MHLSIRFRSFLSAIGLTATLFSAEKIQATKGALSSSSEDLLTLVKDSSYPMTPTRFFSDSDKESMSSDVPKCLIPARGFSYVEKGGYFVESGWHSEILSYLSFSDLVQYRMSCKNNKVYADKQIKQDHLKRSLPIILKPKARKIEQDYAKELNNSINILNSLASSSEKFPLKFRLEEFNPTALLSYGEEGEKKTKLSAKFFKNVYSLEIVGPKEGQIFDNQPFVDVFTNTGVENVKVLCLKNYTGEMDLPNNFKNFLKLFQGLEEIEFVDSGRHSFFTPKKIKAFFETEILKNLKAFTFTGREANVKKMINLLNKHAKKFTVLTSIKMTMTDSLENSKPKDLNLKNKPEGKVVNIDSSLFNFLEKRHISIAEKNSFEKAGNQSTNFNKLNFNDPKNMANDFNENHSSSSQNSLQSLKNKKRYLDKLEKDSKTKKPKRLFNND